MMVLLCLADGTSRITETVFENRFMHVQELQRLGADVSVDGKLALVRGVPAPLRRPGDGERPAGPRQPWCWPAWPPRAPPRSSASTTLDRGYEADRREARAPGGADQEGEGVRRATPAGPEGGASRS